MRFIYCHAAYCPNFHGPSRNAAAVAAILMNPTSDAIERKLVTELGPVDVETAKLNAIRLAIKLAASISEPTTIYCNDKQLLEDLGPEHADPNTGVHYNVHFTAAHSINLWRQIDLLFVALPMRPVLQYAYCGPGKPWSNACFDLAFDAATREPLREAKTPKTYGTVYIVDEETLRSGHIQPAVALSDPASVDDDDEGLLLVRAETLHGPDDHCVMRSQCFPDCVHAIAAAAALRQAVISRLNALKFMVPL